ncbi:hypothetical protein [Cystobacter ferrugineus]|uniref:hypothetical protein n=1 Tax=Cystobacter ferrugineus TaxID=83449 RepID=UPI000A7C8B5F|nr:hypothetical protein [Cystobacter ferrugineus]
MREEQNSPASTPSPQPPSPAPVEHEHWQAGRLLVAVLACLSIIVAAIAYSTFG